MTQREMSSKGGKAGTGKAKARTSNQARTAVNARWGKIPADLESYVASEKFDGIRAFWTGSEFMSRNGNIFPAPAWFKAGMPDIRLDGELYIGRGSFGKLLSQIQAHRSEWDGVKFMVFDLAVLRVETLDRIEQLAKLQLPDHCEIVQHVEVTREQLDALETDIVAGGGEGVCLRHKTENYRPCNFVKVKRLFPDIDRWQG